MNYYEQLGIASTADTDEIRRVHRKLTKIFHPDAHVDEKEKQGAEVQMRRVNAIVNILSDPQRRLEYDKQLRKGCAPTDPTAARILPSKRSWFYAWRWWAVSIASAFVLTMAVLWLWLNDWGGLLKSRRPAYILPEAAESAPASPKPEISSTTVSVVPQGEPAKKEPRSRQNPISSTTVSVAPQGEPTREKPHSH